MLLCQSLGLAGGGGAGGGFCVTLPCLATVANICQGLNMLRFRPCVSVLWEITRLIHTLLGRRY